MKKLDQTKLNIGDKAELSNNYSTDLLKCGDVVEIIGKKEIKEECYSSFVHDNEYYHIDSTVLAVHYLVKTFDPLTGGIVPHFVCVDEIKGGWKKPELKVNAGNFKNNTKLCKKLIKICTNCGELGLAEMFKHARQLALEEKLEIREKVKKEKAEKVSKILRGEEKVA